jgi:hypothetical protein
MMKGRLADIDECLDTGGVLRFVWASCLTTLVYPSGETKTLDGRSYKGFLATRADSMRRTESGSTENKDLIIEWRKS